MTTLMWEAKAAPGRGADLLAWVLRHAPQDAQVYRAEQGMRLVVVDRNGAGLPDVDPELLARPVHVWPFEPVPR